MTNVYLIRPTFVDYGLVITCGAVRAGVKARGAGAAQTPEAKLGTFTVLSTGTYRYWSVRNYLGLRSGPHKC